MFGFATRSTRPNRKTRRASMNRTLGVNLLEDRVVPAIAFTEPFDNFAGAGFAPTPATNQLDSDNWVVLGLSDGTMTYGDTKTTGDFARGAFTTAQTTGGVYAFGTGSTKSLGVQASGSDFNPGSFNLKLVNDANAAADPVISYDVLVRNDAPRSSTFNFSYSLDGTLYTPVAALDYTTTFAVDTNGYVLATSKSATLTGVSLAGGASLFLRWSSADVAGGSGARDEMGLDNVIVTANSGTAASTTTTFPVDGVAPTGSSVAGTPITFKATVTSTGTPTGKVQFRDGGPTGTLLAETATATTNDFSIVSTTVPVGTYSSINAYFIAGSGFSNSSTAAPFGSTLTITAPLVAPTNTGPFSATITGGNSGFVTVAATGNPAPTFTISGPDVATVGAAIDNGTGKLTYSPGAVVTQTIYTFDLKASNSEGFDTDTFTLTVNPPAPLVPFTPGNLVIYRSGDGIATYGSTGSAGPNINAPAALFLDEYTPTGTLVQSFALPATHSGSIGSTSEGMLTLSADGRSITFGAYAAAPGSATDIVATTSAAVPRVLGSINSAGTFDLTSTTTAFSGGNIRSVATANGQSFYAAGSNNGVRYLDDAGTALLAGVQVNGFNNSRTVSISNGRLYWGTGSNPTGIYNAATIPLPTAATTTNDVIIASSIDPYQFKIIDMDQNNVLSDNDRLYLVSNAASPGLQRSIYTTAGGWGTPTSLVSATGNVRGLTGVRVNGTAVDLYGTQFVISGSTTITYSSALLKVTDDTSTTPPTAWTQLKSLGGSTGTAVPIQGFRGVAFVPKAIGGTASVVTITSGTPTATEGAPVTFTAALTGGTPADYVTIQNAAGQALFTGQLDATGKATFTTSTLPVGMTTLTAYFGGNDTLAVGTGTVMQTINAADPTALAIASDKTNPTVGQTVTFTATITSGVGTPTGAVDFFSNGFKLNTTSVTVGGDGKAMFAVTSTATQAGGNFNPGIDHISAIYTPTGTFKGSNGEVAQKVQANAFGAGNILVYRTGDGTNAMTPNGNRIYIDEYLPGTVGQTSPVQSIILPTIAEGLNLPVLGSGQQSAEGQMTISPDGAYAYFPAYNASPTNTASLTTSLSTAIPRVVGRINLSTREIETSLALTNVASAGVFRATAVTTTGSIYVSGSTGGVFYIDTYAPASVAVPIATALNWAGLHVAGTTPQLYGAVFSNANSEKLETIGSGLPTAGTPVTPFPGIPGTGTLPVAPEDFYLADLSPTVEVTAGAGVDTLYIADNGPSFTAGTITKWSWDNTLMTWLLNSTGPIPPAATTPLSPLVPTGTTVNLDNTFQWMTARTTGTSVSMFITNGAGGGNTGGGTVWSITDTAGYNAAFSTTTLTTVATSPIGSRKAFRSVVQLPGSAAPVVTSFTVNTGQADLVQRSRLTTVTVNFAGAVDASLFQTAGAVKFTSYAGASSGLIVDTSNGLIVSQGGANSLTLTFNGTQNDSRVNFGSLADGRWTLDVVPANYTSPSGPTDVDLRRLFGDIDNNGTVDGPVDFAQFGNVFGTTVGVGVSGFDFNNDGQIDGTTDFAQFGNRFGSTL